MAKLRICDRLGERPLDWATLSVAALLPSLDMTLKGIARAEAHVQTLAREDSDLDLGHVQPTGVLGRVMESDSAQQLGGPARTQDIDEAFCEVGVQIVQHQVQASGRTVSGRQKVAHKGDEVGLAAMVGYDNRSRAHFGLNGHEQVASAATHVLVVFLAKAARPHGHGRAAVGQQLQALFVHAHDGLEIGRAHV